MLVAVQPGDHTIASICPTELGHSFELDGFLLLVINYKLSCVCVVCYTILWWSLGQHHVTVISSAIFGGAFVGDPFIVTHCPCRCFFSSRAVDCRPREFASAWAWWVLYLLSTNFVLHGALLYPALIGSYPLRAIAQGIGQRA